MESFMCDIPSYFDLPFSEISLDLLQPFLGYCGYVICKG